METSRTEVVIDSDISELVPGFCESRKKDLKNLTDFLDHDDFLSIAKIGHTIKGVARPYGFPTLEDLAVKLEKAAKSNDKAGCSEILNSMSTYLKAYQN